MTVRVRVSVMKLHLGVVPWEVPLEYFPKLYVRVLTWETPGSYINILRCFTKRLSSGVSLISSYRVLCEDSFRSASLGSFSWMLGHHLILRY